MAVHRVRNGGIAAELEVSDGSVKCVCGADDLRFDVKLDDGLRWVEQVAHDTIRFNFFQSDGSDGSGSDAGLLVQTSVKSKNCLSIMDDIMGGCVPAAVAGGNSKKKGRRRGP